MFKDSRWKRLLIKNYAEEHGMKCVFCYTKNINVKNINMTTHMKLAKYFTKFWAGKCFETPTSHLFDTRTTSNIHKQASKPMDSGIIYGN